MAAQVQQRLHHLQVALVDGDVQWGLAALVAGIQVGASPLEDLDDGALVPKGRVVHGAVTILILEKDQEHDDVYEDLTARHHKHPERHRGPLDTRLLYCLLFCSFQCGFIHF